MFDTKEAIVIRRLFIAGHKSFGGLFLFKNTFTINEMADVIHKLCLTENQVDISKHHIRRILYRIKKMGGITKKDKKDFFSPFKIDSSIISNLLLEEPLFILDQQILEIKYHFIAR